METWADIPTISPGVPEPVSDPHAISINVTVASSIKRRIDPTTPYLRCL